MQAITQVSRIGIDDFVELVAGKIGFRHKSHMLLVDALLRLPTVVGLLFFAGLLLRDRGLTLITCIGSSLAISLAAVFLSNAPADLALTSPFWGIAKILAAPNLALLWWFGRSLLDDDFKLGGLEWAGLLLLSAGNLPLFPDHVGWTVASWGSLAFNALAFAVPVHLVFLSITGWRNDLVEKRRALRLVLVGWIIVSLSVILYLEDANTPEHLTAFVRMALAVPAVWLIIVNNTQIRPAAALFARPPQNSTPKPVDYAQNAALQRLMQAIESERLFLDPVLTLPTLSQKCGMTEYQMRKLINGHLGFANFSAFLNAYRVDEAKRRLAQSDEPITTIALDCGFKTLSTFNRVFKRIAGVTPTLFRQESSL